MTIIDEIAGEMERATRKYSPMASAHEGYAVILEELDELWLEVKKKQAEHDHVAMRAECIQIAAMAARFALDICDGGKS